MRKIAIRIFQLAVIAWGILLLYSHVSAVINSSNQAERNQAVWGLLTLLLVIPVTWLAFSMLERAFRKPPPTD